MNHRNYQKELDEILSKTEGVAQVPTLFLHSCCAPCSSYCIAYLSDYFEITVFYYNPNIYPDEEYAHRVKEQRRFIEEYPTKHPVHMIEGDFEKDRFYTEVAKGLEDEPERGRRCEKCFYLRLSETAKRAQKEGMDYFCTTLTISPMKDAALLNAIGERVAGEEGIPFLPSDFKKKNGYLKSCEISREYGMYRQDYCGCVYSKQERQRTQNARSEA